MQGKHHDRYGATQRGQVLPVAVFVIAICTALTILLYNTAQRAIEKTRAVNAADAAAYSAAVWSARHLNFMAYTNRAMVANHIAAGHLTAYMSWIRYVHDASRNEASSTHLLSTASESAPYMLNILNFAGGYAAGALDVAEVQVPAGMAEIHATNALYVAAQNDMADSFFTAGELEAMMQALVREYDPDFIINDGAAFAQIPARMQTALGTWLNSALARRQQFIRSYQLGDPGEEFGGSGGSGAAIGGLVGAQIGNTRIEQWILGQRGWGSRCMSDCQSFRHRSPGGGTHVRAGTSLNWTASDQYQTQQWIGNPVHAWTGWHTAASGQATASALSPGGEYSALQAHYSLAGNAPPGPLADHQLPFAVLVGKHSSNVEERIRDGGHHGPQGNLVLAPSNDPVTAVGAAEAYFDRPQPCSAVDHPVCVDDLAGGDHEYANLYNPFWRARLSDYTFLLNEREPEPWN